MTKLVYQRDSYIREYWSRVVNISGNRVVLDETIFHPHSGGVDHDTGYILFNNYRFRVVKVYFDKNTGEVIHELEQKPVFSIGDRVLLIIDWDRRYKLMRLHTAAHILSGLMYSRYGALVTGGNISVEKAYEDYGLEVFDKKIFLDIVEKANEVIERDLEVKIYWLPREKALRIPGIIKLAGRKPPELDKIRIVEIPGIDIQADGGPHVRRTSEIGKIEITDTVNKGRKRKRIYYTVKP